MFIQGTLERGGVKLAESQDFVQIERVIEIKVKSRPKFVHIPAGNVNLMGHNVV